MAEDETPVLTLKNLHLHLGELVSRFFTLDGERLVPATVLEWGRWFENTEARILLHTTIDGVLVSTVFMGMDVGHAMAAPMLFETMIFGGAFDLETFRYCSYDEAIQGHHAACELAFTS